jgi:TonB family protein
MFCPDCGAAVTEGRKFCGKCGGKLNAGTVNALEAAPSTRKIPVETVAPVSSRPTSPRTKLAYALVALLVILGGVAWWWFHRPAPDYKAQDPGIYPFLASSADGKPGKWGFIDADGNVLIQPEWDVFALGTVLGQSVAFSEGLCGVQKDGKWGYVDTSGRLVIPNQFDFAGPFIEGFARVKLGNLMGYIDKTGRYAINPQFGQAGDFHGGLAAVRTGGDGTSNPFPNLGRLVAPAANGGWGFINKAGVYVIQAQFQSADADGFSEGLAGVCQNKCGYIDRSGAFVIKPQFASLDTFSEGLASVGINNKLGYIDISGKIVINLQFEGASMFSGGLAVVKVSGHTGTIDKQGKYVLNPGRYNILATNSEVQPIISSDGAGLITRDGKWVVKSSKALTGITGIFDKVFYGLIGGLPVPISMSGKVLAGSYKGAMLDSLAQDIENENSALQSMNLLTAAEASYSGAYPAKGFTASLDKLGPATGAPDENHAGLIDATLASGTKDGYQFTIRIPEGTSTGGANFNYFIVGKAAAGHAGRTYCADSSGTVHYALQGQECPNTPPTPPASSLSNPLPARKTALPPQALEDHIQNIEGDWAFHNNSEPSPTVTSTAAIFGQKGSNFSVRGDGWSGTGSVSGNSGYYDWTFTNGERGRTTFTVANDGTLQGHVQGPSNNPNLNWSFVAKRIELGNQGAASVRPKDSKESGSGLAPVGEVLRAGENGVSNILCAYCPNPDYSDEARNAKFAGDVLLEITVLPNGKATDIRVIKSPGMGLDEKAIEAMRKWKFKPAIGPNGQPVAATTQIHVYFQPQR